MQSNLTAHRWHHALMHSTSVNAVIYAAVRYFAAEQDVELERFFPVIRLIESMTPRHFMHLFPIDKTYDGERWQCKDYFSTMAMVQDHGLDTPIGDGVPFLWDYCNPHTRCFLSAFFTAITAKRRENGQPGLLESYFDSIGKPLPTYIKMELPNGKTYMRNNQTGQFVPVAKPSRKPKWWKIIGGGQK